MPSNIVGSNNYSKESYYKSNPQKSLLLDSFKDISNIVINHSYKLLPINDFSINYVDIVDPSYNINNNLLLCNINVSKNIYIVCQTIREDIYPLMFFAYGDSINDIILTNLPDSSLNRYKITSDINNNYSPFIKNIQINTPLSWLFDISNTNYLTNILNQNPITINNNILEFKDDAPKDLVINYIDGDMNSISDILLYINRNNIAKSLKDKQLYVQYYFRKKDKSLFRAATINKLLGYISNGKLLHVDKDINFKSLTNPSSKKRYLNICYYFYINSKDIDKYFNTVSIDNYNYLESAGYGKLDTFGYRKLWDTSMNQVIKVNSLPITSDYSNKLINVFGKSNLVFSFITKVDSNYYNYMSDYKTKKIINPTPISNIKNTILSSKDNILLQISDTKGEVNNIEYYNNFDNLFYNSTPPPNITNNYTDYMNSTNELYPNEEIYEVYDDENNINSNINHDTNQNYICGDKNNEMNLDENNEMNLDENNEMNLDENNEMNLDENNEMNLDDNNIINDNISMIKYNNHTPDMISKNNNNLKQDSNSKEDPFYNYWGGANCPHSFSTTGEYTIANNKNIMTNAAIVVDGKYRENLMDYGVYDYIEKYTRTSGAAKDGLYCYNYNLDNSPFKIQPTGGMNFNKYSKIELELTTITPPINELQRFNTICANNVDGTKDLIGTSIVSNRTHKYNFDIIFMEERYNIVKFVGGNVGLMFSN